MCKERKEYIYANIKYRHICTCTYFVYMYRINACINMYEYICIYRCVYIYIIRLDVVIISNDL